MKNHAKIKEKKIKLTACGFTLIELLAVIVVLAVIALIATPIVLNVIENSKKSIVERSIDNYIKTVTTTISRQELNGNILNGKYVILENGNLCHVDKDCTDETEPEIKIDASGKMPTYGYVVIAKGQVVRKDSKIGIGDYLVSYDDVHNKYVASKEDFLDPVSFANDSWKTIIGSVKLGDISSYKVGDTKEVALTGDVEGTYTVRITNISTPEECSQEEFSQTACGFVIEFEDLITSRNMNSTDTNIGGWENSELRKYINSTIYNSLPSNLKSSIIDTKVVSGHGSTIDESNFTTIDKLYLLSAKEVWGNSTESRSLYDTADSQSRQLDYYAGKKINLNAYGGNYKGDSWWLRTADSSDVKKFLRVYSNGDWSNREASISNGIAPAFRIG